jgi:uncharacterized protein
MEITNGTFEVELHDVIANDNHTVGLQVARGQRKGKNLDDHQALVFRLRDSKVAEVWQLSENLYVNDDSSPNDRGEGERVKRNSPYE